MSALRSAIGAVEAWQCLESPAKDVFDPLYRFRNRCARHLDVMPNGRPLIGVHRQEGEHRGFFVNQSPLWLGPYIGLNAERLHTVDEWMTTLAHEMVHWAQWVRGIEEGAHDQQFRSVFETTFGVATDSAGQVVYKAPRWYEWSQADTCGIERFAEHVA